MPKPTKETCYHDLRRRVLTTELAPGSDLDERSLCEHYGLSRTPLREVLRRLAGEGFAEITSNRGAKVASMDLSALRTFFQTAPMIYANIARLASENRTSHEISELRTIQERFVAAIAAGDVAGAALGNHSFHAAVGRMARNPYLMACLERLLIDHTRLSQTFYHPADPAEARLIQTAAEQHEAMIAAIERREAALVVDLTLRHWDLSRDRMERFVHPDPLPVDIAHAV